MISSCTARRDLSNAIRIVTLWLLLLKIRRGPMPSPIRTWNSPDPIRARVKTKFEMVSLHVSVPWLVKWSHCSVAAILKRRVFDNVGISLKKWSTHFFRISLLCLPLICTGRRIRPLLTILCVRVPVPVRVNPCRHKKRVDATIQRFSLIYFLFTGRMLPIFLCLTDHYFYVPRKISRPWPSNIWPMTSQLRSC